MFACIWCDDEKPNRLKNDRAFVCADCMDKLGEPVRDDVSGDLFFVPPPLDRR